MHAEVTAHSDTWSVAQKNTESVALRSSAVVRVEEQGTEVNQATMFARIVENMSGEIQLLRWDRRVLVYSLD
jgi:hypothetical protein